MAEIMKVIDLFCGAGGFSEGFKQEGFEIILGVDNEKTACNTFKKNFPKAEVWQKDIRDVKQLPEADVIIGSPPCQGFSLASSDRDENPELIYYFFYLVARHKPKYFVMEEVARVKNYLPRNVSFSLLTFNSFGGKDKRKRLFAGNFPKFLVDGIGDVKHNPVLASEWKGRPGKNYKSRNYTCDFLDARNLQRSTIPKELRPEFLKETKQAMGYPQSFIFEGSFREQCILIGNSVCPPVSKRIAKSIADVQGRT